MTHCTADTDQPTIEDQYMTNRPSIIAAVDLDGHTSDVVEHAAKVAALSRARLIIVHVVDYQGGFESDHAAVHTPAQLRKAMIDHARASLVGLVHLLDLPVGQVEIIVEPGAVADTLASLAAALHPVYVLVGRSRWGMLGGLAGLEKVLKSRAGCDLLVVPASGSTGSGLVTKRLRSWLAGSPALPSKPAHR